MTISLSMNDMETIMIQQYSIEHGISIPDLLIQSVMKRIEAEKDMENCCFPEKTVLNKKTAWQSFTNEIQKGWKSAELEGWLTLEEVETRLGICNEQD